MELYKLDDLSWNYVVLTLLPNVAEISPIWDYLNILLWLNEKVEWFTSVSKQFNYTKFICERYGVTKKL